MGPIIGHEVYDLGGEREREKENECGGLVCDYIKRCLVGSKVGLR